MAGRRRIARGLVAGLSFLRPRFGQLWLLFALVLALGASGLPRVTFDNALMRFFESDFPAYTDFADVSEDFESDANDVMLLFEAGDLADPTVLEAVSAVLLEAQFIEGVRAAISPLSIEIAAGDGRTEPLVPFPLPDAATMAERFDAVRGETPALRRLLAPDRAAMVAVLPLVAEEAVQAEALDALAALVERAGATGDFRLRMAGYPVLRAKLAKGLILDVIVLNAIGAAVGFVVASLALRSVALGLLTLPGPLVSLMLCLGLFGHLGIAITTVSVTLPVLVMILATIDSIHILFERTRQAGRDSRRATLRAVRRIAMACIFAAVTTAIAFAVLTLSRADIIAELGTMGAGVLLLSTAVVLLTQTLVLAAAGRSAYFSERFERVAQRPPTGWGLRRLPRFALAHPRGVTLAAIALLAAALAVYSQAGPRYFVLDSLEQGDPLRATFTDIEEKVVPISMLEVAVRSRAPELLAEVEATLSAETGSDLVQSVASVAGTDAGTIEGLPEAIAGRLLSADGARALVTVPFRYEGGAETLALAARIDSALARNPALADAEISPTTGMSVMSAAVISGILSELNRGLTIAVLAVAALIWLWLGSARIALIALIPNLLPVALIGGFLALSGQGIELANGLALTVAFGVAVDDTLHVLNRIRLSGGFARIEPARLRAAMAEATPVLATTSAVLVLGFGGSAFAATQEVADFGTIATAVFVLALAADLLVLPAAVAFLGPRFYLSPGKGRR